MASAADLGLVDVYAICTEIFGLKGNVHKGELKILCPVHSDHDPSCGINLETGYWNCFSCKAGGDLIDLGHEVLHRSRKNVKKLLQPNEPEAIKVGIQSRVRARRRAFEREHVGRSAFEPTIAPEGSYEDGPMDAMFARGFNKKTLRKFGIRYVTSEVLEREDDDPFEITHAIGIPIFSESGEILSWCYRATNASKSWFRNVRYIYTPGTTDVLNQTWFGLNLHKNENKVVITEGAIDAMWCDQNGHPALAILGSHAKQEFKIRKLMRFSKIVLLPDRDRAGIDSAETLGEALRERGVPTTLCRYSPFMLNREGEPAKDAQDLCPMDLEIVIARAIPFSAWRLEQKRVGASNR